MFLNQWTIAEANDLLRAKDYELGQLAAAVAAHPSSDADWSNDYQNFLSRYQAARMALIAEIGAVTAAAPFVSDTVRTVDTGYKGLLSALQTVPGVVSKGDLQDLWNRFNAASGAPPIQEDGSKIQPTPGTDADLNAIKAADAAAQAVKDAAKTVTKITHSPYFWGGVGLAGIFGLAAARSALRI